MSKIVRDKAVDTTLIRIGRPFFDRENTLYFSAYAFGWGYCAFSLDPEVAHEVLGSIDQSPRQILLAFAIGQVKIRKAVHRAARQQDGQRIRLTAGDFP